MAAKQGPEARYSVESSNNRRDADPVILLPGTLCDDRAFAPLIARMTGRDVHTILTTGVDTPKALAARILAEAPPRFVLIGFSLGGMIALEMVAQAPARVAGLALVGSSARPDRAEWAAGRRADVADARDRGLAVVLLEKFWPRYVGVAASTNKGLQRTILAMAETLGVETFAEQTELIISRTDSGPRLRKMTMPILAMCGAEDVLCPPVLQEEIVATAPNAQLAIIPGAGHFVLLEAPRQATDTMLAWLDHLPTRSKELLP